MRLLENECKHSVQIKECQQCVTLSYILYGHRSYWTGKNRFGFDAFQSCFSFGEDRKGVRSLIRANQSFTLFCVFSFYINLHFTVASFILSCQNKKVILALKTNLMGLQSYFKWSASVKKFFIISFWGTRGRVTDNLYI